MNDAAAPLSLTVVILTKNESCHIGRAIASVASLAARIIVVDSGSHDGTREIASQLGAEVVERPWINYADQFQWTIDNCGIDSHWTMRLDADEWLGDDLVRKLADTLPGLPLHVTAISLDRRHYFMGRWIKHGGRFPLRLLRLWRTGKGHIEQRWMDEHIVVGEGQMLHIDGVFVDENDHGLGYFTDKHNGYATREAIDALIAKYGLFANPEDAGLASTAQARKMRRRKLGWYNGLPTGVGPVLYFLYRYFLKAGFLDGREGLIYHGLQGFWYRLLVDGKRLEFERGLASCQSVDARIDQLSALSGHDLRKFEANAHRLD